MKRATVIKAQIDYQIWVNNCSSDLLKTSKVRMPQLAVNLGTFLFGEQKAGDMKKTLEDIYAKETTNGPPQKKRRVEGQDQGESEGETDVEEEETTTDSRDSINGFQFSLSKQNQMVAVIYHSENDSEEKFTFYIGKVVSAKSQDSATVSFLEKKESENFFKWPRREDVDTVCSKHVFYSDFKTVEKNRALLIDNDNWKTLNQRFESYLQVIC